MGERRIILIPVSKTLSNVTGRVLDRHLNKLAILIVLVGITAISPVMSSLVASVNLRSTGEILQRGYARSGSARDIQAAVDWIVANGSGIGNVYIPAGTFNFVDVGQPWQTVNIPAGVSVFGAPTQRDSNGQVLEWKTILVMPNDVPGDPDTYPSWFKITGTGNPTAAPTRFSDIKLQGYRTLHPSSTTIQSGVYIDNVVDFRADHCCFEHTAGGGVGTWGLKTRGVIDHCRIYNIYAYDNLDNYMESSVGYGVELHMGYSGVPWLPTMSVLGQYTDGTVFIENCYFSKWRHSVCGGHGSFYVFRYNIIDQDLGHFSLDVHGLRDTQSGRRGGRGAEIYENTFQNVSQNPADNQAVFQDGGGCGVWFNNYIDSSYNPGGIALYLEDAVASTTCHVADFYLWSAKGTTPDDPTTAFPADRHVDANWTRLAYNPTDSRYPNTDPSWLIAGYKPYAYPHPLTLAP